jgi:phosphoglucomutase
MGALLLEYIATAFENTGKMPAEPYAVKTIVTSELCSRICAAHGVHLYNVLTGFKFIGEVIKNHEIAGHGTFLLGFEESYGYLKGTYARDKDAVVASLLICEMAAYYKTRHMTLIDALVEIFEKYGYFRESVISISMDGLDGTERMAAMMSDLRSNPPSEIGGKKVAIYKDFLEEKAIDFRSGAAYGTGLPKSDVLYYLMEDENLVVVRPSGTEPKVKVYILANGKDEAEATFNADACIAGARKLIAG